MAKINVLDLNIDSSHKFPHGQSRTIAWPVMAYRLTLPETSISKQSGLNLFERLILEFLDVNCRATVEELSEMTCMPSDFIKEVVLRLQDKGCIDDRGQIKRGVSASWKQTNYISALLFQELVEGAVLPYVHLLNDKQIETKEIDNDSYCWVLQRSHDLHPTVGVSDVLRAIRKQKRHERAYNTFINLPEPSTVSVMDAGESYLLNCTISIADDSSDYEFRIENPFGVGKSPILNGVFMRKIADDEHLERWVLQWRENLSQNHLDNGDSAIASSEPFNNAYNKEFYGRLVDVLRVNNYGQRRIENIYASIEWALFYCNEQHDTRQAIFLLEVYLAEGRSAVSDALKKAAENLKLHDIPENFGYISSRHLERYQEGTPDMPTALSIMVLSSEGDSRHPFRRFAETHPNVIGRLFEIKKMRDQYAHGGGRNVSIDLLEQSNAFMEQLVSSLIPSMSFDGNDSKDNRPSYSEEFDLKFEAKSKLLSRFGYADFNIKIDPLAQDRLINAESFFRKFKDGDDAQVFISDIYAALQREFSLKIKVTSLGSASDGELNEIIENRVNELEINQLPDALSTVGKNYIRQALRQLDSTTLGALVVAFMISNDSDLIHAVLQEAPSFFDDMGFIVAVRGHTNEPILITKEEVQKYREFVYRAFSILMDC